MRLRRRREVTCPSCGAAAPADASWCGTCGARLRGPARPDDVVPETAVTEPRDGRVARIVAAVVVVGVFAGLLLTRTPAEPPVVPAGFTSRGDGARTGVVATTAPMPTQVAWRAPVTLPPLLAPGTDVLGTTTVEGRELLVVHDPSPDGQRITTHDAVDGAVVATAMLPLGSQPSALSLRDGLLAYRDLTHVTLLDVTTGLRRWRVEQRFREASVLTPAGVVGVPAADGGLRMLDIEDGSVRWDVDTPTGPVRALLAVAGNVVAIQDQTVTAWREVDGDQAWQLREDELPVGPRTFPLAAPVSDESRLLVTTSNETVAVVDGRAGTVTAVLFTGDGAGPQLRPAVTALDGDLVVVSDGLERVAGYELGATGARRVWEVGAPGAPVFSLEIAADVVAVRGDGATTLLDRDTGAGVGRVGPAGDTPRLSLTASAAVARVTDAAEVELVTAAGVAWSEPTVATHVPDLATDDGAVAVTTPDGVQVHDVATGDRVFAHLAFEPSLVTAGSLTPPALAAGRAIIAPALTQPADRGGLLALFADTGIVDWSRDDDRVVPRGTPVVDRDAVLVPVGSQLLGFDLATGRRSLVVETTIARTDLAAADGWLVAVDAPRDRGDLWVGRRATRELVFRAPIRTCAPPVIHEDVVIVVDHLDDIVARELETGEQPWGERARGSACRPLTVAGEVLVALVNDRELVGIGLDDGDTAWRVDLPAHAAGAPVVAGDLVLVPTLAGDVVAYAATTASDPGAPVWRVDVGGTPAGSVAVDGDTVLVTTREGELVALR